MRVYNFVTAALFATISLVSAEGEAQAQSVYLDPAEKFHMHWSFTEDDITFTLTVNTTGWFGLGFSENGGMAGADIIMAGVKDGTPYLRDMHATGTTKPVEDSVQNVELLSGWERDDQTSITFKRKHVTCDSTNDRNIVEDTMRLIYAMSSDNSDVLAYHSGNPMFRGARSLYLRHSILPPTANIPADALIVDVRSTNYKIPDDRDTMYTCEIIRVPNVTTKHHLIQMDPIIKPENLGIVHHIILYGCYDDVDREHMLESGNKVHDCSGNPNMPEPEETASCSVPVAIWAIGGGSIYYPEEAGLPFGDENSPRYLMMEVHYDNPQLLSGRFDNSGIRLVLTPTLRRYDAGVMATGAVGGITVPPGANDFRATGYCASDCSKKGWKEPINVFGVVLHGHLTTRQVLARHFRNGAELEMLSSDRNYDFNYQQYREFKQLKTILPGDDLMVTCHYDTSDRTTMTYGGLPSRSEMCIAFLMYYPAQNMAECYSAPVWQWDPRHLAINMTVPYIANTSSAHMLNEATSNNFWTPEKIALMQDGYLEVQHLQFCNNRTGKNIHQTYEPYYVPEYTRGPEPAAQVAAPSAADCYTQPGDDGDDGNAAAIPTSQLTFLALFMSAALLLFS